ncbi:MAG: HAMP domain-containing histidine kinase [Alphaproteobacteria bacterium]|nr:HAMP domain-containing histidine kinase [Alphaproteobacteria bacterium]
MAVAAGASLRKFSQLVTQSLSGRLLLLTLVYVLVIEIVLFMPSIGRYHRQLLDAHIESAELAILPFTQPGAERLPASLRMELLDRAGASAVLLKRADRKQFFLVDALPARIDATLDLSRAMTFANIVNALDCLFHGGGRVLHVVAPTHIRGAQTIGIIMGEATVFAALSRYAERELLISLFLSLTTAVLVFSSLYLVLVRPMSRITRAMIAFRENPEDSRRIVGASARRDEIGIAERELASMQRELFGSLQQKTRLAALGSAVARIQHDLKNILATAQLASDRLSMVEDPVVKHLTPRLVTALDRAVTLATATLRYGRTVEIPPCRKVVALKPLIEEAGESVITAAGDSVCFENGIDPALTVAADPDQLYRIILNLVRNAAEALPEQGGRISVSAERAGGVISLDISDNGPGLPSAVRERLFQPFVSSQRRGGSGLGLAIARELALGHGGDVALIASGPEGTLFRITLPDVAT